MGFIKDIIFGHKCNNDCKYSVTVYYLNIKCINCDGSGAKDKYACTGCRGSGMTRASVCYTCAGIGNHKTVSGKALCPDCNGFGFIPDPCYGDISKLHARNVLNNEKAVAYGVKCKTIKKCELMM